MKSNLQQAKNGILFSDKYFTGEIIDQFRALIADKSQVTDAVKVNGLPSITTNEEAFRYAWAEMSNDPDFLNEVNKNGYEINHGLNKFISAIDAPIKNEVKTKLESTLMPLNYEIKLENDAFVHYCDGDKILHIPKVLLSANLLSSNIYIAVCWATVIFDVIAIICAVLGISISNKSKAVPKLIELLELPGTSASQRQIALEVGKLAREGKIIKLIQKVLAYIRGSYNLKDVIKTVIASASWWEILLCVLQVVAGVVLIIATDGCSIAAKVLQCGVPITFFCTDIYTLVAAYNNDDQISFGIFNTMDIRPWQKPQLDNSKDIAFARAYSSPPTIALGINELDMAQKDKCIIIARANSIKNEGFTISLNALPGTTLYSAGASWLAVPATKKSDVQVGVMRSDKSISEWVFFPTQYKSPPKVVVWLNELNTDANTNIKVSANITNIDATKFMLNIVASKGTFGVTWVAFPAEEPWITSGDYSAKNIHDASGTIEFPKGLFAKSPQVIIALSALDVDHQTALRVKTTVSNISASNFTWNLNSWADTVFYSAIASFIAIAS